MLGRLRGLLLVAVPVAALLAPTTALFSPTAAWACPGCKEATSEQGADIARGYSYSILFMMPIPFLILGSFGGYVYYTVRKRDAASLGNAASPSDAAAPNVSADSPSDAPTANS